MMNIKIFKEYLKSLKDLLLIYNLLLKSNKRLFHYFLQHKLPL